MDNEREVRIQVDGQEISRINNNPEIRSTPERTERIAASIRQVISTTAGIISDDEHLHAYSGTIHRIHSYLREPNGTKYITPKLVSIGPYHHGNLDLQEMEGVKHNFVNDLIRRSESSRLENYIQAVERNADRAMKEYSSIGQQDLDDFVKMMVVDGCFILEFLIRYFSGDRRSRTDSLMMKEAVLRRDMLLMENQIPFFILEELFKVADESRRISFSRLAKYFFFHDTYIPLFCENNDTYDPIGRDAKYDHLLHLYHAGIINFRQYGKKSLKSMWSNIGRFICYPLYLAIMKILQIMCCCILLKFLMDKCSYFSMKRIKGSILSGFPSASSLRDAGFTFRKKHELATGFMDVSISGNTIMIPVLHINDGVLSNFQNLVALEHLSGEYGYDFTAYVMLLDYLIDSADDVAILRKSGIIDNRFGDDQMVADFFNNLCSGIYLSKAVTHYLSSLFTYVREYHENRYYMVKLYWWRKKYIPDYFTNPWAMPSMIAALILLALSIIQTFYTVYPYYHGRP